MHNVTYNELRLDFSITPVSPLSIQTAEPAHFVRTVHPTSGDLTVYIPGTTLRGAMRVAAERVLRSAQVDCCDVEQPCSKRDKVLAAKHTGNTANLYRALCGVCRMFGSPVWRSHLIVMDSFPADPRDAYRNTDSVSVEVVLDTPFYGALTLRNFERWQVGLLALLLTRINIGEIQLGGNRSAGCGTVAIRYSTLSVIYPGPTPDVQRQEALRANLHGVGQLMGANNAYGFIAPDMDSIPDLPDLTVLETGAGFTAVIVEGDADESHGLIDNVLTRQILAWATFARTHKSH
ncbi:MAG: hypothetical protein IT324_04755 [Anaerolineae bacterium]|nr:hypothetical protein [Anaerolineae bacterium]